MDFEPINSQEEFDKRIKERIKRETEKFSDYEDLKTQITTLNSQIKSLNGEIQGKDSKYNKLETKFNESNAKIAKYESDSVKTRIAIEAGLPYEMISRVNGATEDEIKADIDSLLKFTNQGTNTQPLFRSSESNEDSNDIYKQLAKSLNKE